MSTHVISGAVDSRIKPFHEKIATHADRINTGFIIGFFIAGFVLAFFHQTFLIALIGGAVTLGTHFLLRAVAPGSVLYRVVSGLLFWTFVLQYLFQMQGMREVTYVYFFILTILLFYEDWKVMLPVVLYATISLTLIFVFKDSEWVLRNLPQRSNDAVSFSITLTLFVAYAVLAMWWSRMQHAQTEESAIAAITMEDQLRMVNVNIAFADNIAHGKLDAAYGATDPDKLGSSLLEMRESLVHAADREEREKFFNVGMATIGELLRRHADNLDLLCDKVVEELVRYTQANQAFIFVAEHNEEEGSFLRLMAGRAWDRKKYLQKQIAFGDGIVGQVALEKSTVFMTSVPADYVRITSGLGQANPRSILIVPLLAEEELVGVIEFASFREFRDFEIEFLEKAGESIASTIITTRNAQRNKELLAQASQLTEQMRAQEEEIRQNMEEMQATQEEMQRKNMEIERLLEEATEKEMLLQRQLEESKRIREESDQRNEEVKEQLLQYRKTLLGILDQLPHKIFLKDEEGRMVIVNSEVAKAHNLSVDELIGKSDFDFVDAETAQLWRNQELEIIRKGSETYVFTDQIGGEQRTLKTTKMAFYIPHLNQTGLLGVQTDITELEKLRAERSEV